MRKRTIDRLLASPGLDAETSLDLGRLPALERMVLDARDLSIPWQFFLDHFGDHPAFANAGEDVVDERLVAVVGAIVEHLERVRLPKDAFALHRIADYGFRGGAAFSERCDVAFIYFERADAGLLAIMEPGGSPGTKLARFHVAAIDPRSAAFPSIGGVRGKA